MDELQFVWGLPLKPDKKDNYDDDDRAVSKIMMSIWAGFATTG